MGLKFRKFKAKLNWKTKETVPEVLCLRYHIHSEFEEQPVVPVTSGTLLGTKDVIKQKKPALKPPVQAVFGSNTSTPPITSTSIASTPVTSTSTTSTSNTSILNNNSIPHLSKSAEVINNNNIDHVLKTNGVVHTNQNTATVKSEPVPTKGILKKPSLVANEIEETKSNQSYTSDADDYRKSALIFMTENHDDSEEKSNTKEIKKEPDLGTNTIKGVSELNSKTYQEVETGEFKLCDLGKEEEATELNSSTQADENLILRRKDRTNSSDSESEQADFKTVRWRETVVEIKTPNLEEDTQKSEESADDFQVHFVKHQHFSTTGLQPEGAETEESESEDQDQPHSNSYYGNRGAYSSQAASIFFAGEEPEPTPRVRNVAQSLDDQVSGGEHSAV